MKFGSQERSVSNYWWHMNALDDSCKGQANGRERGEQRKGKEGETAETVVLSRSYDVVLP
jgi:hypothetical protein